MKANALLVIISVLLPFVGYIMFFVKKDEVPEAAKTYLYAAIGGSICGILFML